MFEQGEYPRTEEATRWGIDRLGASRNRCPVHFKLSHGECSQMPGQEVPELKHFLQVLVLEGSAQVQSTHV